MKSETPGDRVRQAGHDAASAASHAARSTLTDGKNAAAAAADQATHALDDAAATFREEGQDTLAGATAAMSGELSKLSRYIENRNLDDLTQDARRLARENPGLMIAGGIAVGIALSRFFKASGEEAERSRSAAVSPSFETPVRPEPDRQSHRPVGDPS